MLESVKMTSLLQDSFSFGLGDIVRNSVLPIAYILGSDCTDKNL